MCDEIKATTICECCWKPIEGDIFELDETTMCAECFEYHGGFDEMKTCCICGSKYVGDGNNAEPIKDGECCDKCNSEVVIPERLKEYGL